MISDTLDCSISGAKIFLFQHETTILADQQKYRLPILFYVFTPVD